MDARINLDNITIVLHHTQFSENVGSAARAMCNMGISQLYLSAPKQFDVNRALVLSTHVAAEVVHNIRIFDDLKTALADFNYVVGTTARLGNRRQVVGTPAKMAERLIPIAADNRVAILFGPEDRGLTNDELRGCHALVNIPTADFSSINLAQSVMIVCYELFKATLPKSPEFEPRLALRWELDAMYDQMKEILVRINYIQPDNPNHWMDHFRRFFSRLPFRAREVNVIRGVCRQFNWYARKCYEDGRLGREPDPGLKIKDIVTVDDAE